MENARAKILRENGTEYLCIIGRDEAGHTTEVMYPVEDAFWFLREVLKLSDRIEKIRKENI